MPQLSPAIAGPNDDGQYMKPSHFRNLTGRMEYFCRGILGGHVDNHGAKDSSRFDDDAIFSLDQRKINQQNIFIFRFLFLDEEISSAISIALVLMNSDP